MAEADIDTSAVRVLADAPTGRALIGVADDGANLIIVIPGANGRQDAAAVAAASAVIAAADVVLVQHEIPDDGIFAALSSARPGAIRMLNPAPARAVPASTVALVDIMVPNEHEHPLIGDVSSVPTLIVTEGERGARVLEAGRARRIPAFRVEPVDTVAAGDAFCGALAAGLASGLSLDVALVRASAAGALATLTPGAVPSLPTAIEIDALISRG
jgi:ribokinase